MRLGSRVGLLLAAVALARPCGAAESPPSPETAFNLALWTTLGGVAAGTAMVASGRGEGLLLAGAGLSIGPSLGHFYAGEVGHGIGMSLGRATLITASLGALVVGVFQCFSWGENSEPCEESDAPFILSGVFAAGAVGLAVYDIADADDAVRRAGKARVSLVPALGPDGRAGVVLAGAF